MGFDDLLQAHVGTFGRIQLLCVAFILVPGAFFATNIMEIVFAAREPVFWCKVRGLDANTSAFLQDLSPSQKLSLLSPSVPEDDGVHKPDACLVYDTNFSSLLKSQQDGIRWMNDNDGNKTEHWTMQWIENSNGTVGFGQCKEWEYDEAYADQTLVSTFGLVCDRAWLIGLSKSVQLIGQLFGVFFGGALTDRFGRRPIARASIVVSVLMRVAMSFSPALEMYLATRLVSGAADLLFVTSCYVLSTELLCTKWRAITPGVLGTGYAIGSMISPLVGYLLPRWMHMSLANTIGTTLICLPVFLLPESARWLYCVGRVEEGKKTLQWMAKVNGRQLPKEVDYFIKTETEQKEVVPGVAFYIRSPLVVFRLAMSMYLWFAVSMLYFGLALNVGGLAGSIYINALIMGAIDLPGCWFIQPLVNSRLGRRYVIGITFFLCSITLLSDMGFSRESVVRTVLALIGKFALEITFNALYVLTPELFPTSMRGTALGSSSAMARVGSAVSPFIAQCDGHVPAIIFGITAIIAAVTILALPETRGKPLPESVADMREQRSLLCRCAEK